jgi:peptide/nickel transport system substrate-binding protein
MMGLRTLTVAALVAALSSLVLGGAPTPVLGASPTLVETPSLKADVAAGKLPPVGERIPDQPFIVDMASIDKTPGRHGGELRMLMGKPKDVRMMIIYGYARLIAYDDKLNLYPDLLADVTVKDRRVFTFHLRKGHKWSDGHPFTAEDFRYYWEDVANNENVSPYGLNKVLRVGDERPVFEVIDETTVRYSWSKPNPHFLPALAGARPFYIYRPSHYLKQYHAKYVEPDKLAELVKKSKKRNWASLHHRKDRQYRSDNPEMPTLQPWWNRVSPPSEHFVFKRNAFYHRMDSAGLQLPYIDRVVINLGSNRIIPMKTGAGSSHLQARYLRFDHYTFLKESEKTKDFNVRLWRTVKGSQVALFPNLNVTDPEWRRLIRDVRFRRALSLAINRREINQVVYFGLAREGNNTVLPESPLYKKEYQTSWADYDVEQANALLDELGLTKRNDDGLRLLPDGRPLDIIIDTAGESTEETDVLELVRHGWSQIGVKLFAKPSQREVFRRRVFAGSSIMSIWSGISNGIPTPDMSPEELAPTTQQQYQWPKWGQHVETAGKAGVAADMPLPQELIALNEAWRQTSDKAELTRIWHRMLEIHADQIYTIGVVNGALQPVVVNNQLRNVPEKGFYNWHPGAYFGVYKPDTFWFAEK